MISPLKMTISKITISTKNDNLGDFQAIFMKNFKIHAEGEFVRTREFALVGFKMKNLKFLGIQPSE